MLIELTEDEIWELAQKRFNNIRNNLNTYIAVNNVQWLVDFLKNEVPYTPAGTKL